MHFRGRGTMYFAEVINGVPGVYKPICTDAFAVDLSVTTQEHISLCGPVDVPDDSWDEAASGTLTMSFADVEDRNFALAVLGTVTAAGSPGTVTDEELSAAIAVGDSWFLGALERHRAITGLVVKNNASPPGATLVLNTNYTLDAPSGRVTFLTAHPAGASFSYGYTDPASVAMLTAPAKNYSVMYEMMNRQEANDPGSVELYKVRLSPASNIDYQSQGLQIPQITGKILADTTKLITDLEYGQFGRRVL